jgi:hypothetical protein
MPSVHTCAALLHGPNCWVPGTLQHLSFAACHPPTAYCTTQPVFTAPPIQHDTYIPCHSLPYPKQGWHSVDFNMQSTVANLPHPLLPPSAAMSTKTLAHHRTASHPPALPTSSHSSWQPRPPLFLLHNPLALQLLVQRIALLYTCAWQRLPCGCQLTLFLLTQSRICRLWLQVLAHQAALLVGSPHRTGARAPHSLDAAAAVAVGLCGSRACNRQGCDAVVWCAPEQHEHGAGPGMADCSTTPHADMLQVTRALTAVCTTSSCQTLT